MNTVLEMMALVALTVLYALAWHNQSVREPVPAPRRPEPPESQHEPSNHARPTI